MKDFVRVALVLMCLMSAGLAAQGQTRRTESSCLVMYDPVFWKTKLRLRNDQCRSIREVNAQYYERLVGMLDKPASSSVSTLTLVEQYLSDRNEKIWNIFQPAQRKRWKRLWDHQYAANVHGPQSTDHGRLDKASSDVHHWAVGYSMTASTVDCGPSTVDPFWTDHLIHRLL
jgi:hypothetical protein